MIKFKFWYIAFEINCMILEFYISKGLKTKDQNKLNFYARRINKYNNKCIKYLSKMKKHL